MNRHNESAEKGLGNSIVRIELFKKAMEQKFNLESSRFFLNASTNKSIFELKKIASKQLQQYQDNLNFLNNFTEEVQEEEKYQEQPQETEEQPQEITTEETQEEESQELNPV